MQDKDEVTILTQLDELIKIGNDIHYQILSARRDIHGLWQPQGAGYKPNIFNEDGCCCEHFRGLGSEAWECPYHGDVKKTGKWED